MAKTKIEWAATPNPDGTLKPGRSDWNPVRGCTRVSPGCGGPGPHGGCYAEGIAARFSGPGLAFEGFAEKIGGKPHWTGRVEVIWDRLTDPLKWREPATIFALSMSDLFHEKLLDEEIDQCIIGGESGHRARVFDLAWARDIRDQCRVADVACFVKQLGAKPWSQPDKIAHRNCKLPLAQGYNRFLNDSHGGNPEEWPEDLRVREFPVSHKAMPA